MLNIFVLLYADDTVIMAENECGMQRNLNLLNEYYSTQWFREDNNARNGSREKKPRKAKTEMGERHHGYVRYDDSGKQRGRGPETISQ